MTKKIETKRSLRDLLDKLVAAQKEDICAYSSGHLNESKLFKAVPSGSSPHTVRWATSSRHRPSKEIHKTLTLQSTNSAEMHNALKSFAVGLRSGNIDHDKTRASSRFTNADHMYADFKSLTGKLDDSILAALSKESQRHTVAKLQRDNGWLLPRHIESLTKTEEFNKLRTYESEVLEKEKMLGQSFASGKETIEYLENKLDADLEQLEKQGLGPGFHHLEAYSRAFNELISTSLTFGPLLEAIKRAYDDFLSHLLEGHVTKYKVLQYQLCQLTETHSANVDAIRDEALTLADLDQRVKLALQENNRLQGEVKKEKELVNRLASDVVKFVVTVPEHTEPSQRIEKLNEAICDALEQIKQLREKIRTGCVPTTVCTYLRRCIKETDVDVQQMMSRKEYYEHSISELTADLQEAIDNADTTERDAKKIWKKLELQTKAVQPLLNAGDLWGGVAFASGPVKEEPENDEDDESDKWNWYIS